MIDVSVIVPVYNVEKYIRASVNSMLGQTHKNIEIILVDDGSPDNCGVICDEFAVQDERVRVIHQKNAGEGMARNAGIDAARGKYIYCADPDDLLENNLIEETFKAAEREEAEIVVFGCFDCVVNHEEIVRKTLNLPPCEGSYCYSEFWRILPKVGYFMPSVCLKLIRRDFLVQNGLRFTKLTSGTDSMLTYDIYGTHFKKIHFIAKPYYYYLKRQGSAAYSYKPERFENEIILLNRLRRLIVESPYYTLRHDIVYNQKAVYSACFAMTNLARANNLSEKGKGKILAEYLRNPIISAAIKTAKLKEYRMNIRLRVILLRLHLYRVGLFICKLK